MSNADSSSTLLTVAEAALLLGVSPVTLQDWEKSGDLKAERHPDGGHPVYRRQDVESLAADRTDSRALHEREERLRLNEEGFRRLAGLLPVGMYTCAAPSGVITYYNEQAARLWGRTPMPGNPAERYCGSHRLFRTDGTPLPHDECPVALALQTGESFRNQEVIIERPDGRRLTTLVNIDPIVDARGTIIGVVNVFHDVSAIKRTEQALRDQKESLETLLETLPVAVFIAHDPECRRITGNTTAAELLRLSPSANFSKTAPEGEAPTSFRVLRDGQEIPGADLPIQRAARGETVSRDQMYFEFEDGTAVHVLISARPLYDGFGRTRGAIASMLDITELRNTEHALRDADRRKDEFLATLAHELRNPLAPIRNSINILRMTSNPSPSIERVHDMIDRQVAHLVRLVDDLLELSRISHGTIELRQELVPLDLVINHAIDTTRPLIESGRHQLTVALPTEPVFLRGDPVRLSQVFANLLNNAAKYTDPAGRIILQAHRDGHDVVVTVRDSGIGIPPEKLASVFDMFAQVANPLRRSQDGLGIGLHLVRTLVAMQGGSVRAESGGLGKGSAFTIRLPAVEPEAQAQDQTAPEAPPSTLAESRRVLVVDDNRDAADSLAMLLKLSGVDVHVAYDGASALDSMSICRPSVVFLDLGMPGLDGYEVARQIRADPQFTGVVLIALTGWGQAGDRQSSQAAGFDHHLVKPVDFSPLQALLESIPQPGSKTLRH
jgi:two-component system CheB/CheR fusion protein